MFVARTRKVKVIFSPVLPDIRKSVALFEGFQSSPACPFCEMKMCMKQWWNDTDRGNPMCWEQNFLTWADVAGIIPSKIRFPFLPHSKHITSAL
jgi:hypothetical protein